MVFGLLFHDSSNLTETMDICQLLKKSQDWCFLVLYKDFPKRRNGPFVQCSQWEFTENIRKQVADY